MKNLVTNSADFHSAGLCPDTNEIWQLCTVKPGIPAFIALEAAHTQLDNTINAIRSIPAEDDLPECLKHMVDDALVQIRATLWAVIDGRE